jgi:hypothetical protein
MAACLLKTIHNQYDRVPQYQDVHWPPHLTRVRFHRMVGDFLAGLGFKLLGDFEESPPVRFDAPDTNLMYRAMCDGEGTTVVTLRSFKPPLRWRLSMWAAGVPLQVVAFRSRSEAGDVHITTNETHHCLPPTPVNVQFDCGYRSLSNPLEEMYARHRRAIAMLPQPLRRFRTRADAKNLSLEVHARIRSHLAQIGWVSKDWLHERYSPVVAERIYNEIQQMTGQQTCPA